VLRPIVPTQFDNLDRLPDRPPVTLQPTNNDPIGAMIAPGVPDSTGSVTVPKARQ
jgi:hypothetical protein